MDAVRERVGSLSIRNLQFHQNMAVGLLYGSESGLEYLTLDEAIKKDGFAVTETQHVHELGLKNSTDNLVLLLQGDYMIGGSQNRMVARSIFLHKHFKGRIPVRCVEMGRWDGSHRPFESSERSAPTSVRYAARDQGEVWNNVSIMSSAVDVQSKTDNLDDIYQGRKKTIEEYANKFTLKSNAVGIVVAVRNGKESYSADIFDRSKTMEKNFNKLIKSYALEAIALHSGKEYKWGACTEKDMSSFLQGIEKAEFQAQNSVSLGTDYSITSKGLKGTALVYEGRTIHLTFTDSRD